jgi:hypothetical protein
MEEGRRHVPTSASWKVPHSHVLSVFEIRLLNSASSLGRRFGLARRSYSYHRIKSLWFHRSSQQFGNLRHNVRTREDSEYFRGNPENARHLQPFLQEVEL